MDLANHCAAFPGLSLLNTEQYKEECFYNWSWDVCSHWKQTNDLSQHPSTFTNGPGQPLRSFSWTVTSKYPSCTTRVFRRDSPRRGVGEVRVVAGRSLACWQVWRGMQYRRPQAFITELQTSAPTESKRMTNHNTPQPLRMDLANHCAAFPGLSLLNTRAVHYRSVYPKPTSPPSPIPTLRFDIWRHWHKLQFLDLKQSECRKVIRHKERESKPRPVPEILRKTTTTLAGSSLLLFWFSVCAACQCLNTL
jgi:hypothetical protein